MNDTINIDKREAEIEDVLEEATNGQLLDELEARGLSVGRKLDELEALHDSFYRDPQHAVEAVRAFLRRATGRVG